MLCMTVLILRLSIVDLGLMQMCGMRRLADQLVAFAAVLAPVIGLQRFRRDLVVRACSFSTVPSCDIVLMKHPQ